LSRIDLVATNAVATTLAYLPGKLSIVFRVFVHNRRDGVPILTVGAWFAGVAIGIPAVAIPICAASLARPVLAEAWIGAAVAGLVGSYGAILFSARLLAGEAGLSRLRRAARAILPVRWKKAGESAVLGKVHAGFDMLAHPGWLGVHLLLRVADLLTLAARLYVCARIIGASVSFDEAIVYGSVRFAIATLLPSGAAGSQEFGTAWLARVLKSAAADRFEVVMVFMLIAELPVYAIGTLLGLWRLRPGRVNRGG
jgi:hypothetical protein